MDSPGNYGLSVLMFYLLFIFTCHGYTTVCHCEGSCDDIPNESCQSCKAEWFGKYCQKQNIARGKPANQSSTYRETFMNYTADKAVDGDTNSYYKSCTHTNDTDVPSVRASWTVYLNDSKTFNISQMRLYLRNSNYDRNNAMKIFVGKNSCFESSWNMTRYAPRTTITPLINCTSVLQGNTVTISVSGPFLTLCEVQIFVCSDGWFGDDCDKQCRCRDTSEVCDKLTGWCRSGCSAGYTGDGCQDMCSPGTFGSDCRKTCGKCSNMHQCNIFNRTCVNGCTPGYAPPLCMGCVKGRYGGSCSSTCGKCKDLSQCDASTGNCTSGCEEDFKPPLCNECSEGQFGVNCSLKCGHCLNMSDCRKEDGYCKTGCIAGYTGDNCTACAPGFFGEYCEPCGHCRSNTPCNGVSGECGTGCEAGYQPPFCSSECSEGRFGEDCSLKCGHCLSKSDCRKEDGYCTIGCIANYTGDNCTVCRTGFYGEGSCQQCGKCKNETFCNSTTGVCSEGCEDGFEPPYCSLKHQDRTESSQAEGSVAKIAGGAAAAVAVIPIFVVVIILMRRRKNRDGPSTERNENLNVTESSFNNVTEVPKRQNTIPNQPKPLKRIENKTQQTKQKPKNEYVNTKEIAELTPPTKAGSNPDPYYSVTPSPIPLTRLDKYIRERIAGVGFEHEFTLLHYGITAEHEEGKKPENKKRNRFLELFPYDHSRVVLQPDGSATWDYINASYVVGYRDSSIFIATQGPNLVTIGDFWRMVWQENVLLVVMVTRLVEQNRKKCEQNWPNEKEEKIYGNVHISSMFETVRADFTIRKFNVFHTKKPSEKRELTHLHFTSWPDHDVPSAPALVSFWKQYRKIQETQQENTGPVVIHCSAGVGRTGTFIALDSLVDEAEDQNKVNVFKCVSKMRQARMNMVQTANQYRFVHESTLEAIESHGTFYTASEFDRKFGLENSFPQAELKMLANQFQSLDSMRPHFGEKQLSDARLPENVKKNRNQKLVPAKGTMPFLITPVKGRNNYINAVLLPSAIQPSALIATQTPLRDTVVDYWRLVVDHDCSTIVCLDNDQNTLKEMFPKRNHSLDTGPFRVTLLQEDSSMDSFTQTQMTVTVIGQIDSTRQITLLRPNKPFTENTQADLDVLNQVDTKAATDEKRILVQCSDGASLSGVFCSLLNIITRLRLDKEVDIFLTIRELQCIRPQFIDSYEQYKYCHDVVKEYQRSSSVYSNL